MSVIESDLQAGLSEPVNVNMLRPAIVTGLNTHCSRRTLQPPLLAWDTIAQVEAPKGFKLGGLSIQECFKQYVAGNIFCHSQVTCLNRV